MNVGELKTWLEQFDADAEVILDDADDYVCDVPEGTIVVQRAFDEEYERARAACTHKNTYENWMGQRVCWFCGHIEGDPQEMVPLRFVMARSNYMPDNGGQ